MKLSISNIAWEKENDVEMYQFLKELEITGLEIAPTRIYEINPYDHLVEAVEIRNELKLKYNLEVCSMQSIWYGRNEKLFGSDFERSFLLEYTKKAILFAESIGCPNLVFGSPKNRIINKRTDNNIGVHFFKELGDFAYEHKTIIAMEGNPKIYNTNYINTTQDAIDLVKRVNSKGFKVNLDLGTMIVNEEIIENIDFSYISHIHISEPYLKEIKWKQIHHDLLDKLNKSLYNNYVSIETGKVTDIKKLKQVLTEFKILFK